MSADTRTMHLEQRTTLLPSAAQLQFMSLLPMSQQQVGDLIEAAIRENPLLQRSPGGPCAGCGGRP
jgi:DNA-directed RNA polymerase specialized sigma54-like protein